MFSLVMFPGLSRCDWWGMKLNPSKPHSMVISPSKMPFPPHSDIDVNGVRIPNCSSLKLWVIFDSTQFWVAFAFTCIVSHEKLVYCIRAVICTPLIILSKAAFTLSYYLILNTIIPFGFLQLSLKTFRYTSLNFFFLILRLIFDIIDWYDHCFISSKLYLISTTHCTNLYRSPKVSTCYTTLLEPEWPFLGCELT